MDPLGQFALSIGLDLAAEPALRWLAVLGGNSSNLSTAWQVKLDGGRKQFVEKATGQAQDEHPQRGYYRDLVVRAEAAACGVSSAAGA